MECNLPIVPTFEKGPRPFYSIDPFSFSHLYFSFQYKNVHDVCLSQAINVDLERHLTPKQGSHILSNARGPDKKNNRFAWRVNQ